jgi:hypothetical protein
MHLDRTWLIVIILSVEILAFGEFEHSNEIILLGIFCFVLAILCEICSLLIQYLKRHISR